MRLVWKAVLAVHPLLSFAYFGLDAWGNLDFALNGPVWGVVTSPWAAVGTLCALVVWIGWDSRWLQLKLGKLDEHPNAAAPQPASAMLTANAVRPWLAKHLRPAKNGIAEGYLFGSVAHPYASNDVDILLIMASDNPTELKRQGKAIKKVAVAFSAEFGVPLHLSWFTPGESSDAKIFMVRNTIVNIW
jgi:predicted nucleotidyltransferase